MHPRSSTLQPKCGPKRRNRCIIDEKKSDKWQNKLCKKVSKETEMNY